SYQVLGWFSYANDDPLYGIEDADAFSKALTQLGWSLPPKTDSTLTAQWTLLSGTLSGVKWQTETLPPAAGPPRNTPVPVAVGNSSVEALTAMVAAQADAENLAIDAELLEAFQLDLVDALDEPDGAAVLADQLLASFYQKYSGGYTWTIVEAPGSTAPVTS